MKRVRMFAEFEVSVPDEIDAETIYIDITADQLAQLVVKQNFYDVKPHAAVVGAVVTRHETQECEEDT